MCGHARCRALPIRMCSYSDNVLGPCQTWVCATHIVVIAGQTLCEVHAKVATTAASKKATQPPSTAVLEAGWATNPGGGDSLPPAQAIPAAVSKLALESPLVSPQTPIPGRRPEQVLTQVPFPVPFAAPPEAKPEVQIVGDPGCGEVDCRAHVVWPCNYVDQTGVPCGQSWCLEHIEFVGQTRYCGHHAELIGSRIGLCTAHECTEREVWTCNHVDQAGVVCGSTWCRQHMILSDLSLSAGCTRRRWRQSLRASSRRPR